MSSIPQALIELHRVQEQQPSDFWSARQKDPLLIQSWPELALASTAWSWMDLEPPQPQSPIWKKLWDQALTWPINEDLSYVEQSILAWSEYPVWNSVRSMKLIQVMEQARARDWSSLMLPQDLQSNRFAYHLLHAVCLHAEKFQEVALAPIWRLVMDTPSLRADLKEVLLVKLLNSTDAGWKKITEDMSENYQNGELPPKWMQEFKTALSHRAAWLTDFETLQQNLGSSTIDRRVLANQWNIVLNKSLWEKQVASYAMFDFSDVAPGLF